MDRELGIYIHIPFCARKCRYCDFLSFPASRSVQERYFEALAGEITSFRQAQEYQTVSVYFGGGTPSLPDEELVTRTLKIVRDRFRLSEDAEITIECNPGTLTAGRLRAYREAGFNRLSLGLQSADDGLLTELGRIHTWDRFREEYADARRAGFSNISVDLMYGLPGQTCAQWSDTIGRVLDLPNEVPGGSLMPSGPEHISAYSLIIEQGTPFWDLYHEDEEARRRGDRPLFLPEEEEEERMLRILGEKLGQIGMRRYEISNYAYPGMESRHNSGYWIRREYAGFGLGASGQIGKSRYRNPADMETYLAKGPGGRQETVLTREDEIEETMFLGLRLTDGVDLDRFEERFGIRAEQLYADTIRDLGQKGLLKKEEGRLALTDRGTDLSNLVMAQFLLD